MRRYAATDAAALATQALDAAERAGDAEVAARALLLRGRAREAAGRPDAALADLTRAAAGARAAGDRRLEMLALRELGGDVPVSLRPADHLRRRRNLERRAADRRVARRPGQPRPTCCPGSRSSRPTGCDYDLALDYGLRAAAAGRASADEQAAGDWARRAQDRLPRPRRRPRPERRAGRARPAAAPTGRPVPAAVGGVRVGVRGRRGGGLGPAPRPAIEAAIEVNRRGGYPHCDLLVRRAPRLARAAARPRR